MEDVKSFKANNTVIDTNHLLGTVYTGLLAFFVYACMYGIRKPFMVGTFNGITWMGNDYKTILIIAQVIGYALSKFIGIRVISGMKKEWRAPAIIVLTLTAEIALMLFAIIPAPYNIFLLFVNGIPLGLIWGLVFSYLEGRRTTEILGAILSVSFIVSSGFVKSVGKIIMLNFGVNEFQMPWITGLFFFIPLIIFVWLLDKTPNPTETDILHRSNRLPMDKAQRKTIVNQFGPVLILLTLAYVLLTVFRDLRDNFAAEIWISIGKSSSGLIFIWSEIPIAIMVLVLMAFMVRVKDNKQALFLNNLMILSGFLIIGISALALKSGFISPITWMMLLGTGIFMGYLPFNCLLFDRMIAAFGSAANAGFLIYLADSFGYLGSVASLIIKSFFTPEISWFHFIVNASVWIAFGGGILMLASIIYFNRKTKLNISAEKQNNNSLLTSTI